MCPGVRSVPASCPHGTRRTVLVVDDLPINRRILRTQMQKLGFDVLEASNGLECLESLAAHAEVCAIYMDLKMPVMNGWEAAFCVRSLEAARHKTGSSPPALSLVPATSGSYSTPVLSAHLSEAACTDQLMECDVDIQDSRLPPAAPPGHCTASAHPRIPIIACTATNLEERMCWRMSNRGVMSQGTGGPTTPSSSCDSCQDDWSAAAEPVWMTSTVKDAALQAGVDQVLPKPIAMAALEHSLDTWIPAWRQP